MTDALMKYKGPNTTVMLGEDFAHMSSALLYRMLKSKTSQPLHGAVRLLREDVVFLCLVENHANVSTSMLLHSPPCWRTFNDDRMWIENHAYW